MSLCTSESYDQAWGKEAHKIRHTTKDTHTNKDLEKGSWEATVSVLETGVNELHAHFFKGNLAFSSAVCETTCSILSQDRADQGSELIF
jgi:hypothetical protein